MKLRNLALALTAAALLPTFAYAGDDTDPIRASFDRELNRGFAPQYLPVAKADADPLGATNIALRKEPDQVLASFERELYHEPAVFEVVLVNKEADPLDAIFADLKPIKSMINLSLGHVQNRGSSM